MLHDTLLRTRHRQWLEQLARGSADDGETRPGAATGRREAAEMDWLPYGGPDAEGRPFCEIPASFGGELEAEYAAIRRGAAIMDMPHRATLVVRGEDRLDLLDRLLTQKVRDLRIGEVRAGFLLTRKGRIVADLLLAQLSDKLLIDVDITRAAEVTTQIDAMIFGEDAAVEDATAGFHRISVHGRRAADVLSALTHPVQVTLEPGRSGRLMLEGVEVVVLRHDVTGEPGYEWIVPGEAVGAIWDRMLAVDASLGGRRLVRPAGWHAFNMARIEAGTPIFNVDFGGESLPHETGLLERRVSFTKGCYPGQEVVARMEHLGRPKQVLRGLEVEGEEVPVAGVQVFEAVGEGDADATGDGGAAGGAADATLGDVVGTITSSSPSPMRGLDPVALAVIKSRHAEPGTRLMVVVDGEPRAAIVRETVFFTGGAGVPAVGPVDGGDTAAAGKTTAEASSPPAAAAEGSA
jgi:folate-binding protein YgfZ